MVSRNIKKTQWTVFLSLMSIEEVIDITINPRKNLFLQKEELRLDTGRRKGDNGISNFDFA